jgi:hypothetical protein
MFSPSMNIVSYLGSLGIGSAIISPLNRYVLA